MKKQPRDFYFPEFIPGRKVWVVESDNGKMSPKEVRIKRTIHIFENVISIMMDGPTIAKTTVYELEDGRSVSAPLKSESEAWDLIKSGIEDGHEKKIQFNPEVSEK